jgi:hypothetical protein
MAAITYISLQDHLASMLGATGKADLPVIDAERIGILVNQAYRECYLPIDGKRPQWAIKKFTLAFASGDVSQALTKNVIDVDKIPELVGEGPLSPMSGPEDEIRIRANHSWDFKAPMGRVLNFPSINATEAETGRPIWYYIDTADTGADTEVIPRFYLYPVPDKAYTVTLRANIMPDELVGDADTPRLPADVIWDILYPIAQEKMLSDPRYSGRNAEILTKGAAEARQKLATMSSAQKHKGSIRLVKRAGW